MKRAVCFWLTVMCAGVGGYIDAADFASDHNRPLRLRETILPIFPHALLAEGTTEGWARIVIDVDAAGRPTDWLVVGYTREGFGTAAVNAVRQWRFDPMVFEGRPTESQVAVAFNFEARGVVLDITAASDVARIWFRGSLDKVYRPSTLQEIDGIPVPREWVEPVYPAEFERRGVTGVATVEFYIDETGTVRMPVVVKADFPELGQLLAAAVRQWRFDPPKRRGRPVLVHASQTVIFGSQP